MSADIRAAVEAVLRQYTDPHLDQDPLSAGCVRAIDVQGDQVSVQLELGYAAAQFKQGWAQMLQLAIENLAGVRSATVEVNCVIAAHKTQAQVRAGQRQERDRRGLRQGRCGQVHHCRQPGPGPGP